MPCCRHCERWCRPTPIAGKRVTRVEPRSSGSSVPIELSDVPAGLTIASQSATAVQVWVRASDFVFDSFNLSELVARCDLANAHAGNNVVRLDSSAIDVPPGIKI